jgi:protein FrlC
MPGRSSPISHGGSCRSAYAVGPVGPDQRVLVLQQFSVCVPSYTLEDTIKRIALAGYDGIEIGCAAPHAWPAYLNAQRKDLRALMVDQNLPAVSLLPAPGGGPGNNVASPMVEERTTTIAHYKEVIDFAHDLGASKILYIAGWRVFGTSSRHGTGRWRR